MTTDTVGPIRASERIGTLDVLRGVAVCGILLMNIPLMGLSWDLGGRPNLPAVVNADWIALTIQRLFFEGTMRGLFTLLFGAGMLVMLKRMEEPGAPSTQAYITRCFALMLLGVVNFAILFWPGEILFNYGVAGLALFLFRRANVRVLLTAALALVTVMTIFLGSHELKRIDTLMVAEIAAEAKAEGKKLTKEQEAALEKKTEMIKAAKQSPEVIAKERDRRTHLSTLLGWSTEKWAEFNLTPLALAFLGESLAFMLLGMALFKTGVLSGDKPLGFYVGLAVGGYAAGLAMRGVLATLAWRAGFLPDPEGIGWGAFLYEVTRLPMTLGLLGLVVALYKVGALGAARMLKAIGQLALTNYMGQSLITSVLFYGFKLYDRIPFAWLMAVCVAIWIAQGIFSLLWLRFFSIGPAEWALRSLTYGAWAPLKRTPETAPAA